MRPLGHRPVTANDNASAMRPEDDPSWPSYFETVLEFAGPSPLHVDLRAPVGPTIALDLRMRGLEGPFAVLTAANPRGLPLPDHENRERLQALQQQLEAEVRVVVRVDGCSPDRAHREPGFAATVGRERAIALAVEVGQSAIYWFDGAAFWVVGALVESAPVRLPREI